MKQTYTITIALLLMIAMISAVSASGVVVPYFKDDTLKVYPGDTTSVGFTLQNGGGATQTVTFKATIISGSEIASLASDTYVVPVNGEVPVSVKLNIPSTAAIGTKYPLAISFVSVTSGTSGAVNVGVGMQASVNILVEQAPAVEQPAPIMSNTAWIAVAVIVLVIIIWIILSQKKSSRKRK